MTASLTPWWSVVPDASADLLAIVVGPIACVLPSDRAEEAIAVFDMLTAAVDSASGVVEPDLTAAVLDVLLTGGLRRAPDFVVVEYLQDGVRVCSRGGTSVRLVSADGGGFEPAGAARPWSDVTTQGTHGVVIAGVGAPSGHDRVVTGLLRVSSAQRLSRPEHARPESPESPKQASADAASAIDVMEPDPAAGADTDPEDSVAGLGSFYSVLLAAAASEEGHSSSSGQDAPAPPKNVSHPSRGPVEAPREAPAEQDVDSREARTLEGYRDEGASRRAEGAEPSVLHASPRPSDGTGPSDSPFIAEIPSFGRFVAAAVAGPATPVAAMPATPPPAEPTSAVAAACAGDDDDEATIDRAWLLGRREQGRAPVLVLRLPDGTAIPVDRPLVLGRSPRADRVSRTPVPEPVQLADPTRSVSGTHLEVRPVADAVQVRDLGSSNGTVVDRPGAPREVLGTEPVMVVAGCTVTLGGELVLRCETAEP